MDLSTGIIVKNRLEIAVIDDDPFYREKMKELIHSCFDDVNVDCFHNGYQLLQSKQEYSLIIIDVFLENENGINLADSLKNKSTYIVYYSIAEEMIRNAFGSRIIGFFLKTDPDDEIKRKLIQIYKKYLTSLLRLKTEIGEVSIDINAVVYVVLKERKPEILFRNGTRINTYGSLRKVSSIFGEKLIPLNESTLVNPDYIQHVSRDKVLLSNGEVIDMSRRNRRNIEKRFAQRFL